MTMVPDARLLDDVVAELRWDPRVRHEGIRVAAHEGVVTLTGSVATYAQKRAAERAAERVRGVAGVGAGRRGERHRRAAARFRVGP